MKLSRSTALIAALMIATSAFAQDKQSAELDKCVAKEAFMKAAYTCESAESIVTAAFAACEEKAKAYREALVELRMPSAMIDDGFRTMHELYVKFWSTKVDEVRSKGGKSCP
jgi:hypothetical protein